jgi:hypothetical protein
MICREAIALFIEIEIASFHIHGEDQILPIPYFIKLILDYANGEL